MEWNEFNNRRQHQEEIVDTRKGFLGGSDAAMVYKIGTKGIGSLSCTDRKRIGVLLGFTEQQAFGGNKWTEAGHNFEDVFESVAQTWEGGYDREKVLHGSQFNHFATLAHADYVNANGEVFELKCVQKSTERVLVSYYAQLQWYYMLGVPAVYLVHTTEPQGQYNIRFVERNEGVIDAIKQGLAELDVFCAKIDKRECIVTTANTASLPLDITTAIQMWQQLQDRLAELNKQQRHYSDMVIGYMQRNGIDRVQLKEDALLIVENEHKSLDESVLLQRYPQILKDGDIFTSTTKKLKQIKQYAN